MKTDEILLSIYDKQCEILDLLQNRTYEGDHLMAVSKKILSSFNTADGKLADAREDFQYFRKIHPQDPYDLERDFL